MNTNANVYKWYNFNDYFTDGIKNNYLYFSSLKEMQGVNDPQDGVIYKNRTLDDFRFWCVSYDFNTSFKRSRDICIKYNVNEIHRRIRAQFRMPTTYGFVKYRKVELENEFESEQEFYDMFFLDPYGLWKHIMKFCQKAKIRLFEKHEKFKTEKEFRFITADYNRLYFKNYDYIDTVYIKAKMFKKPSKEFEIFLSFLEKKNIKYVKYFG